MTRERLPDRRPNETTNLLFGGLRFAVTIGFFFDGRPGEVFASGAKSGCDLDYLLDDACVALSLLLQHGVEPAALARSMGRTEEIVVGRLKAESDVPVTGPASIIGALADRLTEYAVSQRPAPLEIPEAGGQEEASATRVAENLPSEPWQAAAALSRIAS